MKTKDIDLNEVERLAGQGLTNEQIALSLGISRSTHFQKKKDDSDYSDAIKRGQAKGIEKVSNALFDNAMNGNVTAQIFFLKNRSPNEWKDRIETVSEVTHKNALSRDEIRQQIESVEKEIRAIESGTKTGSGDNKSDPVH